MEGLTHLDPALSTGGNKGQLDILKRLIYLLVDVRIDRVGFRVPTAYFCQPRPAYSLL